MTDVQKHKRPMSLTVTEGLAVQIIPNSNHEFLMNSKQVANGYATSEYSIRRHKLEHADELIEGKHYLKGVSISHTLPNAQPHQIFWTKRGIVRLGFFIKSKNAKLFRDWAEDLIINKLGEQTNLFGEQTKRLSQKRRHNRLTAERMIDILHDVCKIEDATLRATISNKLKGGVNGR